MNQQYDHDKKITSFLTNERVISSFMHFPPFFLYYYYLFLPPHTITTTTTTTNNNMTTAW